LRKENYCDGDGGGGEETAPFWINLIPFHIYGACDPTISRIAKKHVTYGNVVIQPFSELQKNMDGNV
jgi:hypothetical protein